MKRISAWRFGLCLLLFCVGLLIYADLQSIHQIYRIPDAMINRAPNPQIREELLANQERRNREERIHKLVVGAALAVDAILLFWAASGFFRTPKSAGRTGGPDLSGV